MKRLQKIKIKDWVAIFVVLGTVAWMVVSCAPRYQVSYIRIKANKASISCQPWDKLEKPAK